MIRSEVSEIKKQLSHENTAITKFSGCYVDSNKEIKASFTETFLTKAEEETFKYFEIYKKTLSGTLGKNLLNMEFESEGVELSAQQELLLKLRDSELKDEALLAEFYANIIDSYAYVGNYFITLAFAAYDVPVKTKDNKVLEDASEEVYNYIICSICPVELSKAGLSYNEATGKIEKRTQDWVVGLPSAGFLFPAFNDRSADIHSILYYSKDADDLNTQLVSEVLGCRAPMSAGTQKETFHTLITETLGDDCDYEIVRDIYNKLEADVVAHNKKKVKEPLKLDASTLKALFTGIGVPTEKLDGFDDVLRKVTGEDFVLLASNVTNAKSFEVKAPDVLLKVTPKLADKVHSKMVDGRKCLVLELDAGVEVNGIQVKTK